MADELRNVLGVAARLIPGSGGAFEIEADGKMIFSKLQTGRFPEPDEIVKLL